MLLDILRALRQVVQDPLWGFLIVLLGLLVLSLASLALYRRRKILAYSVSRRSLAEDGRVLGDGPSLSLDGWDASDVDLLVVRLTNAGGAPVREKDYARPIRFEFGENARILSFRGLSADAPLSDAPVLAEDSGRLELQPLFLEEGATVEVEAVLAGFEKLAVTGGIGDAGRILNAQGRRPPEYRRWMRAFLILECSGLLAVLAGRAADPDNYPYPPTLLAVAGAVIMCAGALSLLLWLAMTAWTERAGRA